MISRRTTSTLLGAALVAVLLAGCGAATSTAGRSAAPTPGRVGGPTPLVTLAGAVPGTSGAITSPGAVGSPGSSASVGPCDDPSALATDPLSLPHANAKLEDLLPTIIGGVCLQKLSFTLQAYMSSTSGGDNGLYPTWLIKFNKTPAEVIMAIAADLTGQENFVMHAIEVPGADAAALSSDFATVATNAGWAVTSHTNLMSSGKTVLEIIDPVAKAAGGLSAGYVYAKGDVLYTIITDSPSLLLETLIHMP
jgi:hypothetical protein